ncbi:MAG TPA: iron ABC transporter permease [Polyangia bacterium]|jgi:iron complex transport system permease protein|nr:iron ABC transporter permease [Polyangia bacterium]
MNVTRTYLALFGLAAIVAAAALFVGHGSLADPALRDTFLRLRAYRLGAAFLAGASLAAGGAMVQSLFRNPLVDPSIVGTTAGASLGGQAALLALHWVPGGLLLRHLSGEMVVPLGAMLGALLALALLMAAAQRVRGLVVVLLTGAILSSLFLSIGGFILSIAQDSYEVARAIYAMSLGGVSGVGARQLMMALPLALIGLVAAWAWGPPLDLLLSGEQEAESLGLDVRQTRLWTVVWVAVLTTAAVTVGGNLAFVGLIVPHALRPFVGVLNRRLIPAVALAGGTFVVACDLATRSLPTTSEVPLGVVTGLVGAPLFLTLLFRSQRELEHG